MGRIAKFTSAVVLLATSSVLAQSGTPAVIVITGHPYFARRTISTKRSVIADTSTRDTQEFLLWRDNQGRTRHEQIQRSPEGGESRIINVSDPVARRHLSWQVGPRIEKEVFATPISGPMQTIDHVPGSDLTPAQRAKAIAQQHNPNMTGEPLGTATINGVEATGFRGTLIIPAGAQGNEKEIKILQESWRSTDDLGLVVRSITDDPRSGITDIELTEIDRSNPDPSLFEPPSGYRMHNAKP